MQVVQAKILSSNPPFLVGSTWYSFRFSVAAHNSHLDPLRLFNSLSKLMILFFFILQ
jgi:hypothetical protein